MFFPCCIKIWLTLDIYFFVDAEEEEHNWIFSADQLEGETGGMALYRILFNSIMSVIAKSDITF